MPPELRSFYTHQHCVVVLLKAGPALDTLSTHSQSLKSLSLYTRSSKGVNFKHINLCFGGVFLFYNTEGYNHFMARCEDNSTEPILYTLY